MLRPTWNRTGHFGDALSRQSLGKGLKKLNVTQENQDMKQWPKLEQDKHMETKSKSKATINYNNWLTYKSQAEISHTIHVHHC